MNFIDTHSHIYDEAFDLDFNETIDRIKSAGIVKIILPAIDSTSYSREIECKERLGDFAEIAMGLHPTSVAENWREELDFALNSIAQNKVVAVGEIGIDGYWSKEFIEQQKEVFRCQLRVAKERDLPVIIHSREATEEMIDVLQEEKSANLRGVFHAYTSSYELYERLSTFGDFYFGIGGVVTYKNAQIAKALERIPLERVILETDSPYLPPVPFRGKRNESSYIPYIAEKISQIKLIPIEEVADVTTKNAKQLFNI